MRDGDQKEATAHQRKISELLALVAQLEQTRALMDAAGKADPVAALRQYLAELARADVLCAPSLGGESFGMVHLFDGGARRLEGAGDHQRRMLSEQTCRGLFRHAAFAAKEEDTSAYLGRYAHQRGNQVRARDPLRHSCSEQAAQPDHRGAVCHVQVAALEDAPDLRIALRPNHEIQIDGRYLEELGSTNCSPQPRERLGHADRVYRHPGEIKPATV